MVFSTILNSQNKLDTWKKVVTIQNIIINYDNGFYYVTGSYNNLSSIIFNSSYINAWIINSDAGENTAISNKNAYYNGSQNYILYFPYRLENNNTTVSAYNNNGWNAISTSATVNWAIDSLNSPTIPNPWSDTNLNQSELFPNTNLSQLANTSDGRDMELFLELTYPNSSSIKRYYKNWDLPFVFNNSIGTNYNSGGNNGKKSNSNISKVYSKTEQDTSFNFYDISNNINEITRYSSSWKWCFTTNPTNSLWNWNASGSITPFNNTNNADGLVLDISNNILYCYVDNKYDNSFNELNLYLKVNEY